MPEFFIISCALEDQGEMVPFLGVIKKEFSLEKD